MPEDSALVVRSLGRLDAERMRRYRENLAFFDGKQWQARVRGPRDRQLVYNYVRTVVEKSASFLLAGLKSVIAGDEGNEDHDALRALRGVYEDNGVQLLDFDAEVDASVLGDGAFKVTWDVDEGRVRVVTPDVQGLYAWSEPGDFWRLWRVAERYEASSEQLELIVGARRPSQAAQGAAGVQDTAPVRRTSRPARHKVVEVWTKATYELFVDGNREESKANPYGWVPYVVYPNVRLPKMFWGVSDVVAMRESQRELNRAMSQLSMILELSGNPIAVLENVTGAQGIAVEPGAVWEIPAEAKAYLLDLLQGGGVSLHTGYVEVLYRTLHDLGETPRTAFGEADAALSGVAMELQLDPLVKKSQRKRLIREQALRRRDWMVLQLLAQFAGAGFKDVRTSIVWGSLLPQDRTRDVQDAVALVRAGVSSRRAQARALGSEDAQGDFEEWLQEERRLAMEDALAMDRRGREVPNGDEE